MAMKFRIMDKLIDLILLHFNKNNYKYLAKIIKELFRANQTLLSKALIKELRVMIMGIAKGEDPKLKAMLMVYHS
jgi:hypothetical protein